MKKQADRNKDSVIRLYNRVLQNKDSLAHAVKALKIQTNLTNKALKQADSAKQIAVQQLEIAKILNQDLQKEVHEKFVYKDNLRFNGTGFAKSNQIDSIIKDCARNLCLSYLEARDLKRYEKTYVMLDKLAIASDSSLTNPDDAAYQLKNIYNITNGTQEKNLVNLIGLPMFNSNVFRKQEIIPDYDAAHFHTTSFAISPDRTKFAYNVEEDVVEGKLVGDSLTFGYMPDFKHSPHLTSLGINNTGDIIAREKKHLVYLKNGRKKIFNLPVDSNAYFKLSPDGSMLFTLKNDLPQLWRTSDLIKDQPTPISFKDFDQTIYSIAFSNNNQLIALGYANGVSIFDLTGKLISTRIAPGNKIYYNSRDKKVYVTALNFSSDSKSIIMGTSQQEIIISNLSKLPTTGQAFDFRANLNEISNVSLSPDEQNILAGSADDGKYFILNIPENLFKKLPIDTNIVYADFLSSSAIIYAGFHGKITIYNIPPKFNNLNSAISKTQTFKPLTSIKKKASNRIVDFGDLMLSNDPQLLHDRGYSFQKGSNNKDSLNKAKQVFTRLVAITKENPKYDYLKHLIDVNAALNKLEPKNYFAKVTHLKENIMLYADILQLTVSDSVKTVSAKKLSNNWGDLAYNQLFIKDYKGAISSSQTGLQLIKSNDWINTNLALGYLLSGDFESAKAIYLQYKDKTFNQAEDIKFKTVFLEDLAVLESESIITSDNTELYAHVEQIKEMLK
ncbi:hypothetical protein [Mucilaginibacter endophyticus]|uniref:hypothetical protein n=1 Tax=Mucilaginibacter endophyticus TaxID=2675003 RepID=UPI000E0CCAEC|nr:hypothetical protein [Mucilaginibacter endophyticus]